LRRSAHGFAALQCKTPHFQLCVLIEKQEHSSRDTKFSMKKPVCSIENRKSFFRADIL